MIGMTPAASADEIESAKPYDLGALRARDGEPTALAIGDRPMTAGTRR